MKIKYINLRDGHYALALNIGGYKLEAKQQFGSLMQEVSLESKERRAKIIFKELGEFLSASYQFDPPNHFLRESFSEVMTSIKKEKIYQSWRCDFRSLYG